MMIYEALPDVHFRFAENGHLFRCCGNCGKVLRRGAADPCTDSVACRHRQLARAEGGASPESIPAEELLEREVLLCGVEK